MFGTIGAVNIGMHFLDGANRFLSSYVPKEVSKAIAQSVTQEVETLILDFEAQIKKNTFIYCMLTALTCVVGYFSYLNLLGAHFILVSKIVLYGVPAFITVRFFYRSFRLLPKILGIEKTVKKIIREETEKAGILKKTLIKFYDSRSDDDLAKLAMGQAVFSLASRIQGRWKLIGFQLICYFVSYGVLLGTRLVD